MKSFKLIFLAVLFLFLLGGQNQVKYFLSELDFLANRNVPKSEVVRKSHIRAEYDALDRLVRKSFIDRTGKPIGIEEYSYLDTNTVARQKDLINTDGELFHQTIFGREPQSVSYIEWVFGVDSVKKWDDRFTTTNLNDDIKPKDHRFFDVDAFEYGGKEFDYDSLGRVVRDEWFRRPDGKSMHKFLFKYYDDLEITHMFEYDSNGVLIMDVKLSPDGTEAVFWFTGPPDSTFVNSSEVSYNLDGDLKWGEIKWTIPGSVDSVGTNLRELKRGDHKMSLTNEEALLDSFIYDVHFDGEGVKGYMATKRKISSLIYDISPPLMTLEMDKYMKEVALSFTASEPLDSGFILWVPDSNFIDTPTDTILLTTNELEIEGRFTPVNQTGLVDGVMYNPEVYGYDRAGNLSFPGVYEGVIYDITPPILSFISPDPGAWINHQRMEMNTNEPIQQWSVQLKWQGDLLDKNSPYYHEFSDTIQTADSQNLMDYFQLQDGTMYSFEIIGTDLAGNISDTVKLDSIHYDITPPVITMIYPFDNEAINSPAISYAISEQLSFGEILWTQTDGMIDTLSPHIVQMTENELGPDEKIKINMINEPVLMDGSTYSITANGIDLARNESKSVTVSNILYDITPPSFTDVGPYSGNALNHQKISYTVSENLFQGEVIWIQTGGIDDPDAPHNVKMNGEELLYGQHNDISLNNMPRLQDGGIYTILFTGSDRAGNIADTISIKDILYDFTNPQITVNYPTSRLITNTTEISYNLSEDIYKGEFVWTRTGGLEDTLAPYTAELINDEMKKGAYSQIQLTNIPEFVENAIYTLTINGIDRAGNKALETIILGVEYDFTPPQLTWNSPMSGDAVNHKKISFSNSELLKSGIVTWTWLSGVRDIDSVHTMQLYDQELNAGSFGPSSIVNAPPLVDGGIYAISYSAFDPAGNESNLIKIEDILYDITQPQIILSYPLARSISKTSAVTYSLSETLYEGEFKWMWLGGVNDPFAPYTAILTEEERQVGNHIEIELSNNPTVVENALYTMSLSGRDRAGNKAKKAYVPGLQYDFTPPELSIINPDTGSAINYKEVHFSNSELLQSAQMIWERTGGNDDPLSPHISELENDELLGKEIGPITLYNQPQLNDGSEYTLLFVGLDPAGNISDTIKVVNILYDITAPLITITYPQSDIYTAESKMLFNTNEDLYDFQINWDGLSNNGSSDNIQYIPASELSSGDYNSDNLYVPELKDATTYTISINGQDRATNRAVEAKINDIRVDLTPPEFSNLLPPSGSFINLANIGWYLSEDIDSGTVYFQRAGSEGRLESVLIGEELRGGQKTPEPLSNYVALRDGEVYTISIIGIDFASNISEELSVTDITYDTSPPIISMLSPKSGSFVNSNHITFSVNEPMTQAKMIWVGEGLDPLEFSLREADISEGQHTLKDYGVTPQEKIYYSIYIEGTDRATNTSTSDTLTNVTFDITPPEFSINQPIDNSPVNSTQLTLFISEPLSTGNITWTSTVGVDTNSPHVRSFSESERTEGEKKDFIFADVPPLVDGVSYRITISGTDLAGNKGIDVSIENILYDITPPEFIDTAPPNNSFIREAFINYTLTEDLVDGKIYFENVGGSSDPKTTHMITLAGGKKNKGVQGGNLPKSFIRLVNGSIYNIRFEGVDAAGNTAPEVLIENIVFDNEKPVLKIIKPDDNSFINSRDISFSISEDLDNSTLLLTSIAGTNDPNSPHQVVLSEDKRKIGTLENEVFNEFNWVDGTTYKLEIDGIDFAGNEAEKTIKQNITYDITNPIVSIVNLNNNIYINKDILSYTLSEPLAKAILLITQTGGIEDTYSPQRIELIGKELSKGSFEDSNFRNKLKLNNGSIYTFELSGEDYASNVSNTALIENINFDNQPPEISISRPIDAEQIKSTVISYMSSENLESAVAIFTQTSGTVDVNSPHRVDLNQKELKKGVHSDYDLGITSQLADGGRYNVTIEAFDRSGNAAIVQSINDVFFDLLPPVITIDSPTKGSRFNSPIITYSSNEEMGKGKITFTRTGGSQDPQSPHIINLNGGRLSQGAQYDESFNDDIALKDGSVYTITFGAQDMAGNIATDISVQNIIFDSASPEITILSPQPSIFTNNLIVNYSLNEDLKSGKIRIERTGGPNDSSSPYELDLLEDQLKKNATIDFNISEQINLASNAVYKITVEGVDIAGNEGISDPIEDITFDDIPPDISIISPAVDSFINTASLGLRTNEALETALVDWVWDEGEVDAIKEHTSKLVGGSLQEGEYPQVEFDPPPSLISGSWYNVTFYGKDRAGNSSSFNLGRLFFDNTPPLIVGKFPNSNAFTNIAEISYSVNEDLIQGTVSWSPADGSQSIDIDLAPNELSAGTFGIGVLNGQIDLVDGGIYNIDIKGIDKAQNESTASIAKNITFDLTKPKFTQVFPLASSRINTQTVEWNVDEPLQSGKYTWIHMGGEADPNAPHEFSLSNDLLKPGKGDNSKLPPLDLVVDAMYRITLEGTDLAGNTGKKFIMSVVYDNLPPQLELKYPLSNSAVNHLDISYSLNEQLSIGQIIYSRVGGEPDPNSPVTLELVGNELETNFDTPQTTSKPPVLNDGSIYNIQFKGSDLATNSSESNIIENVKYDITRPKITIFYPSSNSYFMGSNISIDISEDLKDGRMVWTRTGGLNDNVTKHFIPLYDQYLKKGKYENANVPVQESLSSGVVYSLGVDARDFADNEAEPVLVEFIEFIRDMSGKWYYKGAIIEVVWIFEPDESGIRGNFMQGLSLGTKISDEERGTFTFDFNQKPYLLTVEMDDPSKNRISLVEFMSNNRIRVVTGQRKPASMGDGEVMEYEWRPE
ncbi:MAG: Ig-like domain-containing protein [Candidatus Neomarinimicrobiota bacterium]|nr:Ig-like domain-containing protein [Candidatus Neomarinimicrobiota bacterium]